MTAPLKFHLFNCDRVYKLDSIEDLLMATKAKLHFEFSVEKHYFPLQGISELSSRTIPELQIDFAVLAVHANESRLSINEDAGGGYTEVYRALLKATEKVIVVIGGDDNYKDEAEEAQSVVSRWAWRKIARSQFKEEFIDGRKSFVFSWNKKHRVIHEKALLHYFDPGKKGEKFEYQPSKVHVLPNPVAVHGVTANDERTREEKPEPHLSQRNAAQEEGAGASLTIHSSSWTSEKSATRHSEEGAQAAEKFPLGSSGESELEDLVVLGCDVSPESMQIVWQVIEDICPRLNMAKCPPVKNISPVDIKSYLMRAPPRFCVLVVDAATLPHARNCSPERRLELEELVKTAAEKVVEKVILTICGPCHLPSRKEDSFEQTIECILKEKGKGLTVWLEDGKLNVEPDVLIQLMLQTSTMEDTETRKREFPREAIAASSSVPDTSQATQSRPHVGGPAPLQEPRQEIQPQLLDNEQHIKPPQVQLPEPSSYEGLLYENETLMLKTRIRYGKVSFETGDLEYLYPDWMIPLYLVESLDREYSGTPDGDLLVISDEVGNLRSLVKVSRVSRCLLV